MSIVTLPASPGPRAINWSLVDPGGTIAGPLGSALQRRNVLGARWRCEVELPAMRPETARLWAARLSRGLRLGVSWKLRQVATPTGSPGAVLIAGADQVGDSIDVDGGNPGYVARAGQWCSILTGGRRYLYQVNDAVRFGTGGIATIEIEPPLRKVPADNDPVEFAAPVIEGLLSMPPGWTIDAGRMVRGFSFAIEEVR